MPVDKSSFPDHGAGEFSTKSKHEKRYGKWQLEEDWHRQVSLILKDIVEFKKNWLETFILISTL